MADTYYAQKIASGLMEPVECYLTKAEIEATVNGRIRGDGRRLDHYVPLPENDPWQLPDTLAYLTRR